MAASSPSPAKKEASSLTRFFANPIVGVIGTLASIIGVLLAVYFYVQSTKFRELVYYVNPAQAIVVKTGEASRLRVLMGERELKSDVTTAQIAIWNRGSESLKPADVLKPITIQTVPSVPILEVTLRKKSREVIDISLDQKHLDEGIVGLSWNILEQGDGGVVQIVYAGNPENTRIVVRGAIEGKREIHQLQYSGKILSVAEQMDQERQLAYLSWFLLIGGITFVITFILLRFILEYMISMTAYPEWGHRLKRVLVWGGILLGVFGIVYSIIILVILRPPNPPFGF